MMQDFGGIQLPYGQLRGTRALLLPPRPLGASIFLLRGLRYVAA